MYSLLESLICRKMLKCDELQEKLKYGTVEGGKDREGIVQELILLRYPLYDLNFRSISDLPSVHFVKLR